MDIIAVIVALCTLISVFSQIMNKSGKKNANGGQNAAAQPEAMQTDLQTSPAVPAAQPRRRVVGTFSAGRPSSVPEGISTMQPRLRTDDSAPAAPMEGGTKSVSVSNTAYEIAARRNPVPVSATQLRRAMVLKEVLDRPLSLRKGLRQ